MKISHNELLVGARKAFEGLGFRAGDAEDAAEMVSWLELHGLDGVGELGKALRFLDKEGRTSPQTRLNLPALRVLDAGGASVLCTGGIAVDAGVAMARRQGAASVYVVDCHNRMLITGYVARCARRGVSVIACWHNGADPGVRTVVSVRAGEALPTVRRYVPHRAPDDHAGRDLTLHFSEDFDLSPRIHPDVGEGRVRLSATPEELARREAECLESGLTVDAATWEALRRLAARILV